MSGAAPSRPGGRLRPGGAAPPKHLVWALCLVLSCGPKAPQVTLRPVTYEQWQKELAALKGHIVVVDIWATWCAPCVERFPHMVRLSQQYKDRATFVSLSVDDRSDRKAIDDARRFLIKQDATFRNYLMDENILQAFERLDIVSVPTVFLYDRSGRQRYNLNGNDPNRQFTQKDVEEAVAALVAES